LNLDLQQRSCEFLELLEAEWDSSRAGILDRMPVPEGEIASAESRAVGDRTIDEVPTTSVPQTTASPARGGGDNLLDLGDLLDDGPPQPAGKAASASPMAPAMSGGNDLLDLLGGGSTQATAPSPAAAGDLGLLDLFGGSPAPSPPAMMAPAPAAGQTMVAYEKAGLKIDFECRKEPDGSSIVTARFCNSLQVPLTNFVFEAAVPKYVRLTMQPATGQIIPPGTNLVTQTMSCFNSSGGEKGLLMKLRIAYVMNGAPVQEMAQVGNFPPGY